MFLACRSDRLLDQRNGLFLCIVTHSYYKAYNNSFQQGFHILFQQNNSRNWNVDVHCELNSLLEIPVCAQDLLTLQLYYFFGGGRSGPIQSVLLIPSRQWTKYLLLWIDFYCANFGSFNYNGELQWWCLFNESQDPMCSSKKFLVCTFFLSSLIATHSYKCWVFFGRFLLNPGMFLIKHIGVHLKISLHATVTSQKAKKTKLLLGRN